MPEPTNCLLEGRYLWGSRKGTLAFTAAAPAVAAGLAVRSALAKH